MSSAAQDRMARALEGIERNTYTMSKDISDISDTLIELRAVIQEGLDAFDKTHTQKEVTDADNGGSSDKSA